MFPGQNVYVTSHSTTFQPQPINFVATSLTLIPQTVNGLVQQVSNDGPFTTYDVTLPSYDLIPSLATQPGQTTALNNPNSVVVCVDLSTQMCNSKQLAPGDVFRFTGLLLNDGGTHRMDCGTVEDGVAQ